MSHKDASDTLINSFEDPFINLEAPRSHPNPEMESARRIRKARLDGDVLRRGIRVSTVARSDTASTNGSQSSRSSFSVSSQVHGAFSRHGVDGEVQPTRNLRHLLSLDNVIVTGSHLSTLPPPYAQSTFTDRDTR